MNRIYSFLSEIFPEPRPRVVALSVIIVFAVGAGFWLNHYLSVSSGTWLQRRINTARSGAVIEIDPGNYQERIQIRKSITLMPKEDEQSVSLSSIAIDGDCQVTLRHIQTYGIHTYGSAVALLENVSVSSSKLCLSVSDQSRVTAVRCDFSGSISSGTRVADHAQFRAKDCTWSGNLQSGIVASGSAIVELQGCTLTSNQKNGITLADEVSVTMVECRVSRTGDDAFPRTFRDYPEWGTGIWIQDRAELHAEHSTISGNARNGVEVSDIATVRLQSAIVSENGNRLIIQAAAEETSAQESTGAANYGLGVLMSGDCDVFISDCEISGNLRGGIALYNAECIGEQLPQEDFDVMGLRFVGNGNRVASPGEVDGNREFDCCPKSLCSGMN